MNVAIMIFLPKSRRFNPLAVIAAAAFAFDPSIGPDGADINALPQRLREFWDITEARKAPLDPRIVNPSQVDDFIVHHVYFTSEQTAM